MNRKVTSIASHTNNGKGVTPEMLLIDALNKIRENPERYNKAVIILLDDKDGGYDTNYFCADLRLSEVITLSAILTSDMIEEMREAGK